MSMQNGRTILLITIILSLSGPSIHAREIRGDYKRESEARIRYLASKRDIPAIYLIGIRNHRAAIPVLQQLAATPVPPASESDMAYPYRSANYAAKAILTRMGVHDYFDEFVVQLSTSDPLWKQEVMDYLGFTGDKRAIKYLGPLLENDTSVSISEDRPGRTFSGVAAEALSDIVQPARMKELRKLNPRPHPFSDEWKQWWKENKDKYQ